MALRSPILAGFFLASVALGQYAGPNATQLTSISTYAQMCMAAYSDPASCESVIPTMEVVSTFSSSLGQDGYTATISETNTVVIVFEGSHDVDNFLLDLDVESADLTFSTACESCTGHSGAVASYLSAKKASNDFADAMAKVAEGMSLVITGHSLGAAVATMAAIDYVGTAHSLYTYGEFRCTNQAGATFIDDNYPGRSFRVVHNKDIVPNLIPENKFFASHGTPYVLKGDLIDTLVSCTGDEDKSCQGGLSISDHLLYIAPIYSCVPETKRRVRKRLPKESGDIYAA